ncbi:MAG: hypothetical protein QG567_2337 [Campylobacterota bacterium]|nr:hypothetical protein [Campylobacterota bacterium]
MQIIKKSKKEPLKISTLAIRVDYDFDKKWKEFAKENKINTSLTIRAYLEKIMKKGV